MHPAQQFRKLIHKFTYKFYFLIYSISWEQRKLGEVGKARSGIGFPDAEQGGTEGIPFFKVSDMNLDGNGNEMNHANNYVSAEQIAARRWAPITEVPAVFFAKVGAAVMLNRKRLCRFPFLLDNNTMAYSLDQNVWDADFAKALFETVDLTSLVQVGALPSYNAGDVEAMEIMLPTMAEQEKIGLFFARVDNLITLRQRKYDKLLSIKKSMLEKMFPRDGSKFPEIRFSGFTNPWEQRKLGDCFIERVESMPDGELISVTINDGIKKFSELGRHDNSNEDKSKYKKVCVGDIAYNSMRMWQGASGYSPYEGIVSPAYTVLSPNSGINSKCLAYQFKLPEMIHIFQINSQGITSDNWNLKYPALSQIEILISIDEGEQTKIAEYFTQFDNLITLHQRKSYIHKKEDFQC